MSFTNKVNIPFQNRKMGKVGWICSPPSKTPSDMIDLSKLRSHSLLVFYQYVQEEIFLRTHIVLLSSIFTNLQVIFCFYYSKKTVNKITSVELH